MSESEEDKKDKVIEQDEVSKVEDVESDTETQEETVENNNEDGSKNEDVRFPSARLLLSVAQKENDYEIDRKKTFDTRSAVLIAFTGVLITQLTKIMESTYFKNVQPTEFISYAVLFGLFFLLPLVLLLVAIYCFLYVIIVRKYARFDLVGFEKETAKLSEEQIALYMMEKYRDVVNNNCKVNDRKSVYFLVGVVCLGVAAFLTVCMTIIAFD
jgi:hypothetical protein